jgi:ketosteroid isomerase-like protein
VPSANVNLARSLFAAEVGQTQTKSASLLHVRGGEVTRLVMYWDRDRALADLGLAPQ